MIGKLLGHSQVQTTARYAHLARNSVKVAAATIADSLDADMDTPPEPVRLWSVPLFYPSSRESTLSQYFVPVSRYIFHYPINEFNKYGNVAEVVTPNSISSLFPRISFLRNHHISVQVLQETPKTINISCIWRRFRSWVVEHK